MRARALGVLAGLALGPGSTALAADEGDPTARLVLDDTEAWTGQRVTLHVELRAPGSFVGAASFDLPEVERTVMMKVGDPVLGSETVGDSEVFVQRHEFALFSQLDGTLDLPPITARFGHRRG